jgi:hypothetical protein
VPPLKQPSAARRAHLPDLLAKNPDQLPDLGVKSLDLAIPPGCRIAMQGWD